MAEAGGGYSDDWPNMDTQNGLNNTETCMKYLARARHENYQKRIKPFFMLSSVFLHAMEKRLVLLPHSCQYYQMNIEKEDPPFQVQYRDG
jgi:hypothetical protein